MLANRPNVVLVLPGRVSQTYSLPNFPGSPIHRWLTPPQAGYVGGVMG